jgi:hypothetical protein
MTGEPDRSWSRTRLERPQLPLFAHCGESRIRGPDEPKGSLKRWSRNPMVNPYVEGTVT